MRDLYEKVTSSNFGSMVVPSTGESIDSYRQQYVGVLIHIKSHLSYLEKMGCVRAHIHLKKDGKTMFMNTPASETGERKYIHVGVNPEKQKDARDKVYREGKRARISESMDKLNYKVRDLDSQLDRLLWEYGRALSEIKKLHAECEGPNEFQGVD